MLGTILTLWVAAIHLYIALLEMVLWESPRALRIFKMTATHAADTRKLALNQGLYNGFLGVGLIFAVAASVPAMAIFLLLCVSVAGVVGLMSGVRSAFVFQTLPATAALLALWLV